MGEQKPTEGCLEFSLWSLMWLVAIIGLAVLTRSLWAVLMVIGSLILSIVAAVQASEMKRAGFVFWSLAAMGLLVGAEFVARRFDIWPWPTLWMALALLLGLSGGYIRDVHRGTGNFGIFLSVVGVFFALLGAQIFSGSLDLSRNLAGLGSFLGAAIRSVWGIVYILLWVYLGNLLLRKWGSVLALVVLLGAVWAAGGLSADVLNGMIHVFSSGPAIWMTDLLNFGRNTLGSAGWGALLAGVITALLIFPALRASLRMGRSVAEAAAIHRMQGTTGMQRYLQQESEIGLASLLASFLLVVATIAFPIFMWVALRRMSGATPPDFALIGIPDITVPHWRPIWSVAYFVPPVLSGLINITNTRIQRHYTEATTQPFYQNPYLLMFGALLLGLFVPSGVILLLIGQGILSMVAVPLAYAGLQLPVISRPGVIPPSVPPVPPPKEDPFNIFGAVPPVIPPPSMSDDNVNIFRISPMPVPPSPQEVNIGREEAPVAEAGVRTIPPEMPALAGMPLLDHPSGLVGLAMTGVGAYAVLDERGNLIYRRGRETLKQITDLNLSRPLGLEPLPEGKLLVVDQTGKLVIVASPGSDAPDSITHRTGTPIACYGVNPFGTAVAFGTTADTQIRSIFLAAGEEQILSGDINAPSAMAYSVTGRYLAIGTQTGELCALDMASRRYVSRAVPDAFAATLIVAIYPDPVGRWFVAYQNGFVACWSAEGRLERHMNASRTITALAVDTGSGRVAIGDRRGYVLLAPADLSHAASDDRVHGGPVIRLSFVDNGSAVMSASADGTVRRLNL